MSEKFLYCKWCMVDTPVYSVVGHKEGEMDLACSNCGKQIARLKKDKLGEWKLDVSFYSE